MSASSASFTGTLGHGGAARPASATAHVFAVVSLAVALVLITFVHVVVGEQMPKLLALQFPEKLALYLIRPMRFFMALFRPLVWVLNEATSRLIRAFGLKPAPPQAGALSEEELLMLVSESKKAGVVSEDEQRMLQRVFKFHSKTVREIMVAAAGHRGAGTAGQHGADPGGLSPGLFAAARLRREPQQHQGHRLREGPDVYAGRPAPDQGGGPVA